jgi:UDP-glucose 4-epimerase
MNKEAITYLVTGGCGFIGSYVIRDLLEEGAKVIVYDFKIDKGVLKKIINQEKLAEVMFVQGEILDSFHLMNIIKAHKISRIIHLASLMTFAAEENPPMAIDVISKGTLNVFEAARILEIEKVVWASSIAVFGAYGNHGEERIRNDAAHRPNTMYGACKSLNEYIASAYVDKYGMDIVGLRYTLAYGPGRVGTSKSAFATEMIRKGALQEPHEVPYGDDAIDWLYVEDISKLTVTVSKSQKTETRVFNTRGDLRPVKEVVDYIKGLVPEAQFTLGKGTFGICWNFDTTRLEEEIGFKPKYSMERGVLKTLNTFRREAGLREVKS